MTPRSYRTLPPAAKEIVLDKYLVALEMPAPREQLSCVLALTFGLMGIEPAGVSFEAMLEAADVREDVNVVCDEAADAVLDVLARNGATFRERR